MYHKSEHSNLHGDHSRSRPARELFHESSVNSNYGKPQISRHCLYMFEWPFVHTTRQLRSLPSRWQIAADAWATDEWTGPKALQPGYLANQLILVSSFLVPSRIRSRCMHLQYLHIFTFRIGPELSRIVQRFAEERWNIDTFDTSTVVTCEQSRWFQLLQLHLERGKVRAGTTVV